MPIRQVVIEAVPQPPDLLFLPFLQAGIVIDNWRGLAAVKALSASALARLPLAMNQPYHAERLPCVLA